MASVRAATDPNLRQLADNDLPNRTSKRAEVVLPSPCEAEAAREPEAYPRGSRDEDLSLDPMARHLARLVDIAPAVPVSRADGLTERLNLARTQTLELLFPVLVRKAAWQMAPDRRSATLQLEIGSGMLDGSTVIIRADLDEVRIELNAPPGIDLEAWKHRLRLRLASHGLIADIS